MEVWSLVRTFLLKVSALNLFACRNDNKSVSIVALGCMHPNVKVQSASMHFFLGETDDKEDAESDDDGPDIRKMLHQRTINKKSRSTDKKVAKAVRSAKKVRCPVL